MIFQAPTIHAMSVISTNTIISTTNTIIITGANTIITGANSTTHFDLYPKIQSLSHRL